nr:hypothetical protein [Tanacetum cinerariifolium]
MCKVIQKGAKDQGYADSRCSRHMTRNMSYLLDFKEFNEGYVTFGGGANGGKITGKGIIKTDNLDFEDVYFVKELKFNLLVCHRSSKDKTTGLLKKFIIEIENLVDKKVKIIRCDSRTEFKNNVMNDFCTMKGIRREFSVARTLQQNSVAERRNRTLIEAAKTMLADSKLPAIFWAEVVNTSCYVQNRALVVKPHNKTPYELFRGKTHALSFMRPFRCHVTILNTLDHFGKFNGKADEGAGPEWLFDIDMLTKSMNYMPVITRTNSNNFAGTKDRIGAGQSSMETGSTQDYIFMPLWKDGSPLFNSSLKISDDVGSPLFGDARMKHDEVLDKESGASNELNFSFENLSTKYPDDLK